MDPTDSTQNIYAAPRHAEPAPPPQKPSAIGKWLAIIGACMQVGTPIGVIWTVISIKKAFSSLGASGIGDPSQLSAAIGETLIATVIGLSAGVIGLMLIFVALSGFRYRAAWLFWFLILNGLLSLLIFPIGTIIGIVILIYSLTHRKEFLAPSAPATPPQPLG